MSLSPQQLIGVVRKYRTVLLQQHGAMRWQRLTTAPSVRCTTQPLSSTRSRGFRAPAPANATSSGLSEESRGAEPKGLLQRRGSTASHTGLQSRLLKGCTCGASHGRWSWSCRCTNKWQTARFKACQVVMIIV